MIKMNLNEAEGHLGQLLEEAASGEDVIITGRDGFTVRLTPLSSRAGKVDEPGESAQPSQPIGPALDRFIGTWTANDEAEFLGAVEIFERVDESFWA